MASSSADIFDQAIEQIRISRALCRRALWARLRRWRPIHGAREGDFEERIVALVGDRFPEGYCCRCIAADLEVPEIRVRNAAQVVIAQHHGIRVARGRCGSCHRADEVLTSSPARES